MFIKNVRRGIAGMLTGIVRKDKEVNGMSRPGKSARHCAPEPIKVTA